MAEPQVEHRVAAVTGGWGGIGAGIAIALTRRGFNVVVCDRTINPAAAERLTAQAEPGARVAFVAGDLTDLNDHPRFVDAIFAAFGRLDCLVNNTGVSVKSRGDLPFTTGAAIQVDGGMHIHQY